MFSLSDFTPTILITRPPDKDELETLFQYEDNKHLYLSDIPYFMNKSIIIAGMVHNVGDRIAPLLESLDEIHCIFKNTVYFIFESNSDDNTAQILDQWSTTKQNADYKLCGGLKFKRNRKVNVRWDSYSKFTEAIRYSNESIRDHRPSKVDRRVIHNDSLVIDEFVALQNVLNKSELNRIERYTVYRNMMLREIEAMNAIDGIEKFDYLMLIDPDIYAFDARMLFNEVHHSPTDILCANGQVRGFDLMFDIFASVMPDGVWMHSFAFDRDKFKLRNTVRSKVFPKERYQEMKSCFGGIAVYKSVQRLLESKCRYRLVVPTNLQNEYIDNGEYIMKDADEELQGFADIYESWVGSEEWVCEHLGFHYCLRAQGWNISIARNARVYYSSQQVVVPMNKNVNDRRWLNKDYKVSTLRNKHLHKGRYLDNANS